MSKAIIEGVFAAADTCEPDAFLEYFSDSILFRYGNGPTLDSKADIRTALSELYAYVTYMRHDLIGIHDCGDIWAVETRPHYTDPYGRDWSFPACNLIKIKDGKIIEYRIFVDNAEMFIPPVTP